MIDFDISVRWFRVLYISVLAVVIYLLSWWLPAAICMLAVFDINIDKNLFKSTEEDSPDESLDDRGFGPES